MVPLCLKGVMDGNQAVLLSNKMPPHSITRVCQAVWGTIVRCFDKDIQWSSCDLHFQYALKTPEEERHLCHRMFNVL
ncbi:hypothetical protein TNCV_300921 [Trichonephila clavipes]|nr:hypothetical protein TNCV_300921 [Trichonephila clavipes]